MILNRVLIFDRYLMKELIGPFIFGISAFSCILAGSTILFPMVNDAVQYGIPFMMVIRLLIYKLPSVIVFTLPMSTLLATIMSISRLNQDLEILAFRAGGISIYRIVFPIVLIGLCISLITIGFNEFIVPKSNHYAEKMLVAFTQSDKPDIKKNINFTEYDDEKFPKRIINVQEVDADQLKHIFVAEYEHGKLTRLIRADAGRGIPSGGWEFYQGEMHNFSHFQKGKILYIEFKKETIDIPFNPIDLTKREKSLDEMDAKEIKTNIAFKNRTGVDTTSEQVKYYMRFAIPFASLIFSILGVSVGIRPHRTSSSIGIGISLMIIIIYYILISGSMYLGLAHLLPALVSAWLPNLIIGATGLFMLSRVADQ